MELRERRFENDSLAMPTLWFIQTSVLRSQSLPDWVEEMPQDSKYYWAKESVGIRVYLKRSIRKKPTSEPLVLYLYRYVPPYLVRQVQFSEVTADEGSSFKMNLLRSQAPQPLLTYRVLRELVSTLTQQPIGFSGDLINLSTQKTWRNLLKQPETSIRDLSSGLRMIRLVNYSILFLRTRPSSKLQEFLHYSMGKSRN